MSSLRLEDLGCGDLKILQDSNLYTFTSDSVILANFIRTKASERCLEIGMGSGVISLLLSAKQKFKEIVGFEIQKEMFSLAGENIKLNNLQDKITIINDDILNYSKHYKTGQFDVVFSNPPYMKVCKQKNSSPCRNMARHEDFLPLEKLTKVMSDILKFGGRGYIVYGADRSCELIHSLMKNSLQPKTMFFTENGKGRVVLVVVEFVKGGNAGVSVLPNLVTNDKNGDYYQKLTTRKFLEK